MWAQLILAVVKLAGALSQIAERHQLLSAGQAMEAGKHNAKALEAMRRVARAHGTSNEQWVQHIHNKYDDDHPLS
ncbi:MAG: hypothetical protein AAGA36_00155 [Pseudomonadota bacterium]